MQSDTTAAKLTRRGFITVAAGLALGGCRSEGAADSAPSGSFSVTVEGKFGRTTLTERPRRVITLGYGQDTDAAVALGVIPVAMPRGSSTPGGIQPWVRPLLGDTRPELLQLSQTVPFEKVAALRPDLFLAVGDYHLESSYASLTEIAPVLGYVSGPNLDPWPETTRRAGLVLGKETQAARVISDTERKIAEARAGAALDGRTFTCSSVGGGGGQVYTKNSADDVLALSLAQFGLKLSPKVTALSSTTTAGIAGVGPEQLDLLDADLLLISYDSDEQRRTFEATPLFSRLPSVRRGSYVALDKAEAQALAFPSALATAYTAGHIVPKLAAAAR